MVRTSQLRRPRAAAGFTLIELMTAVAIIAFLSGMLYPVFGTARERARQTQCSSNLRQIGLSVLQYAQDYDEIYPTSVGGKFCEASATGQPSADCSPDAGESIPTLLDPYLKCMAVWKCPSAINRDTMSYDYGYADYLGLPQRMPRPGNGSGTQNNGNGNNTKPETPVKLHISAVCDNIAPSTLVMACDIMDPLTSTGSQASAYSDPTTWHECEPAQSSCTGDFAALTPPGYVIAGLKNDWTVAMPTYTAWPAPRHHGQCMFLYSDGHVRPRDVAFEVAHDEAGDPYCEFCNAW